MTEPQAAVSFEPCWVQAAPERVNTHAALPTVSASASAAAADNCNEPSILTRSCVAPRSNRGGSARHASRVLWVAAAGVPHPYIYGVALIGPTHHTNYPWGPAPHIHEVHGPTDREPNPSMCASSGRQLAPRRRGQLLEDRQPRRWTSLNTCGVWHCEGMPWLSIRCCS